MVADFFAGLVAGTGLGILIDPRLRAWVADAQWRSGRDVGSLTTEVLERLRRPDPVESHEALPGDDEATTGLPGAGPRRP